MNIGELFVNLGIKGSEKTIGQVSQVSKGLKEAGSSALEMRVALIGAMYAFERLVSASNKTGTSLTNFGALMGGGVQTLQRYQYIASQIGSSNEEMAATFENLSSIATETLTGHGAPERIALLSQEAKLGYGDMMKLLTQAEKGNSEPLFQAINKAMQNEKNVGYRGQVMKDFGISKSIGAGMIRDKFNVKDLAAAPVYSDKEIASLDRSQQAWSRLGMEIERAIGKFNSAHGEHLVNDISKMVTQVLNLANAFEKLAEKAEIFKLIGKTFEALTFVLEAFTKSISEPKDGKPSETAGTIFSNGSSNDSSPINKLFSSLLAAGGPGGAGLFSVLGPALDAIPKSKVPPSGYVNGVPLYNQTPLHLVPPPPPSGADSKTIAPALPATASSSTTTQNINVNQNLNFQHEGKDAAKTATSIKKATQDTYRTLNAQSQVN